MWECQTTRAAGKVQEGGTLLHPAYKVDVQEKFSFTRLLACYRHGGWYHCQWVFFFNLSGFFSLRHRLIAAQNFNVS